MSETLHKLQVVIEGNSSKLTQVTREAMQETRRMTSGINAELKKISSPFAGMKSNPVREITHGIRDMMKQIQIASGMKVYTDDYKKICKDISTTEKELDKLQGKMADMEGKEFVPTQEFKDLEKNIQKSSSALEKLNSQKVKMEQAGKDTVPTEDYTAVANQMSDAQNRRSSLKAQMEEWKGLGVNGGVGMDGLRANIEETEKEISYLKGELKDLQDTGGASRQTDTYRDLTGEITRTEKKLQEYKDLRSSMLLDGSNLEESEAFRKNELAIQDATKRLREYNAEKASMEKSGSDVKLSGQWKNATAGILSKSFSGMKSTLGQVTAGIKTAGGAFASLIQRFRNGIPVFSRTKNAAGGLGGAFKTLGITAKFMLASFLISNSVRGAADGIKNLAKYSSSTNAELSSLMNSLNLLKNSLASAFSPVLSAIAPALDTLINYCVNSINAIGQLFAALTGQGTYYKAVKGNQDFAAGLSKSADRANNSAKTLKNTLMGFDEINKLDDDSGSGGSGGSGGGGSAGSFDMVPVENAYADFAKRIKDAWAKADFTELGGIFGTKIRDALNNIPWDKIKETAQKVGKSLATFINGAVEVSGLADAVGNTVAQALNTGVLGADSFMKNLHWDSVGQFVADSMNSFVKKADWKGIGTAVKDGINGVITAKATWAEAFDFKAAGEAVKTAVKNALTGIKWTQANTGAASLGKGIATALNSIMTTDTFSLIGKSAASAVNTVISGAYEFIGTIDFKGWGKSIAAGINSYFNGLDWKNVGLSFSNTVLGILDFLKTAIQETSWRDVGVSIAKMLKGIDWVNILSEVGNVIFAGIKGALELAIGIGGGLLDGIDWGLDKSTIDFSNWQSGMESLREEIKSTNDEIREMIKGSETWKTAGKSEAELAKNMANEYFKLKEKQSLSNDERDRMKTLAKELVTKYPDLKKYYDDETGLLNTTKGAVDSLIEAHLKEAQLAAAKDDITTAFKAVTESTKNVENATKNLSASQEKEAKIQKELSAATAEAEAQNKTYGEVSADVQGKIENLNTELNKATVETNSNKKALKEAQEVQKDAKKNYSNTLAFLTNVVTETNSYTESINNIPASKTTKIESKITTPASTLRKNILDGWNSLGNTTVQLGTKLLSGSSIGLRNEVWNGWNGLGNTAVSVGTFLKSGSSYGLKKSVVNGWNGLKSTVVSVGTYLRSGATRGLRDSVVNGWNGLGGVSVSTGVGIRDSSSDLWNKVQNLWNNYGAKQTLWFQINPTAASWTPGRKATGGLYTSGQWRPITAAASGGAFSTGQMFIAREAGPELVGSIGRSTAVMNNTQIVSSVAAGVYSAVVSAFSQYAATQNSQSGTANINVYVGGKQVTDVVVEEVNRRTSANGVCPIRT